MMRFFGLVLVIVAAGCDGHRVCAEGEYVPGPPERCVFPDGGSIRLDDAGPRDDATPADDAGLDASNLPDAGGDAGDSVWDAGEADAAIDAAPTCYAATRYPPAIACEVGGDCTAPCEFPLAATQCVSRECRVCWRDPTMYPVGQPCDPERPLETCPPVCPGTGSFRVWCTDATGFGDGECIVILD